MEGWLGIEGGFGAGASSPSPQWERRWCQIVISVSEGATLLVGKTGHAGGAAAPAYGSAAAPAPSANGGAAGSMEHTVVALGGVLARPWPKSRRAVAPWAFRLDVPLRGSQVDLDIGIHTTPSTLAGNAKLILDPGSEETRTAWMHAFAAALAVTADDARGGAAGGAAAGARSSMSVGGALAHPSCLHTHAACWRHTHTGGGRPPASSAFSGITSEHDSQSRRISARAPGRAQLRGITNMVLRGWWWWWRR
jgi:hypothetical protein